MHTIAILRCIQCHVSHKTSDAPNRTPFCGDPIQTSKHVNPAGVINLINEESGSVLNDWIGMNRSVQVAHITLLNVKT